MSSRWHGCSLMNRISSQFLILFFLFAGYLLWEWFWKWNVKCGNSKRGSARYLIWPMSARGAFLSLRKTGRIVTSCKVRLQDLRKCNGFLISLQFSSLSSFKNFYDFGSSLAARVCNKFFRVLKKDMKNIWNEISFPYRNSLVTGNLIFTPSHE